MMAHAARARVALPVRGCGRPLVAPRTGDHPGCHDHDTDHRSEQGPRLQDGPPPDRRRPRRLGRRPRRRRAAARRPRSSARASSQLDVTDDASVAAAAETVAAEGGLDVLVNNAGISGGRMPVPEVTAGGRRARPRRPTSSASCASRRPSVPLLERSANPVDRQRVQRHGLVRRSRPTPSALESTLVGLAYPAVQGGREHAHRRSTRKALPEMRVNAVDPGYTATDFNGHRGPQTVEEGTEAIVRMASSTRRGPTGTFTDRHGTVGGELADHQAIAAVELVELQQVAVALRPGAALEVGAQPRHALGHLVRRRAGRRRRCWRARPGPDRPPGGARTRTGSRRASRGRPAPARSSVAPKWPAISSIVIPGRSRKPGR